MTQTISSPSPDVIEATRQFTLWALAALPFRVEPGGDREYRLLVPEDRPQLFNGASSVRFTFTPNGHEAATEVVTPDSRMFQWVVRQLSALGTIVPSVPHDFPQTIHEITPRLFDAYKVDGGSVRLAGCALEDRPLLRLTYRATTDDLATVGLIHMFITPDGRLVEDDLARSLGLGELKPAPQFRRSLSDQDATHWLAVGRELAERCSATPLGDYLTATVVWLKHAEGKLLFTIGDESVELPFSGWAPLLVRGIQSPPPFVCPHTGMKSYHLAATDDDRIAAAEMIAICGESGRRCLQTELKKCDVTGAIVLPEYLAVCPVSERRMVASAMVTCDMCRQQVATTTVKAGRCAACRQLSAVRKEQPQLSRVLGQYPGLDRWRSWKMAETATSYILEAESLFRRLLVVMDRESLQVSRLATATRFSKRWTDVPESRRDEYLGH